MYMYYIGRGGKQVGRQGARQAGSHEGERKVWVGSREACRGQVGRCGNQTHRQDQAGMGMGGRKTVRKEGMRG